MIKSFADKRTKEFWDTGESQRMRGNLRKALKKKLVMLHSVAILEDLRVPPGNRLEQLMGDREGQHSIRVNDQFRLCFAWRDGDAYDVEVVDHH